MALHNSSYWDWTRKKDKIEGENDFYIIETEDVDLKEDLKIKDNVFCNYFKIIDKKANLFKISFKVIKGSKEQRYLFNILKIDSKKDKYI